MCAVLVCDFYEIIQLILLAEHILDLRVLQKNKTRTQADTQTRTHTHTQTYTHAHTQTHTHTHTSVVQFVE